MKILFITIPFREYISEISTAITNALDARVDIISCDTLLPYAMRGIDVFFRGNLRKEYNSWSQKKHFRKLEENEYDYIFVLVGRNINIYELKRLFFYQKKAKKILYLWDDIARVNTFKEIEPFFDKIYSFDSKDCRLYNFDFLPLFFCASYKYTKEEKNIDFSSIGGLHSSREKYLTKIVNFCVDNQHTYNFHLQTTPFSLLIETLKRKKKCPAFIGCREISMKESSDILKHSICVVDMPHLTQTGLTIRTIEALASQTKLITTNEAIREYDFYNENNILITDENCSNLTEEFIRTPYVKVDNTIVEKYSLDSWVKNIFLGDR